MDEVRKNNQAAIDYLKNERKVSYLVHFTPLDNLPGILKYGILPRSMQTEECIWTDENRYDGKYSCSSFSIAFPNYQMFFKKRISMKISFAVILIRLDALNSFDEKDIAYLPNNASSGEMIGSFEEHIGIDALKTLYIEETVSEGRIIRRFDLDLKERYTTLPQSEIMIRGRVSPDFIFSIYTENEADEARAKQIVLDSGTGKNVGISKYLFSYRDDYEFWQKPKDGGSDGKASCISIFQ